MKNFKQIVLCTMVLGHLSCSSNKGDDPSQFLSVDLGKSSGIIIPAPASTSSCEQIAKGDLGTGAVSGSYFTLPTPRITWTGDNTDKDKKLWTSEIRVVVLKMTIKSPKVGGEYTCTFSDLGLGALFYNSAPATNGNILVKIWDGKLGRNSTDSVNSTDDFTNFTQCRIKCGGMSIPKGTSQFSATGEYELLAVQRKFATKASSDGKSTEVDDKNYEEFPIKVTGSFTVDNSLN